MSNESVRIGSQLAPQAVALAELGSSSKVAVYAGAGLSLSEPCGLPNGAEVARRMHKRLSPSFPDLAECSNTDLVAVADVVSAQQGGELAGQTVAAGVAEYLIAKPSVGHRILAHLLLEGLVDVLTTNWDDCIERGSQSERISSVVSADDLQQLVPPTVLKVHGCATRPQSLLLSSAQLAAPPAWVVDETRSRLGNSTVVFIGIGDVARYVRLRIEEAVASVSGPENIRIVSPSLETDWESSQWQSLLPGLSIDHRIAKSADRFLEELAAAYVMRSWQLFQQTLEDSPVEYEAMDLVISQFGEADALSFLTWVRDCAIGQKNGRSVVSHQATAEALLALGCRSDGLLSLLKDGRVMVGTEYFDVVIAIGAESVTRIRREISNRTEKRRAASGPGVDHTSFLLAGVPMWRTTSSSLPTDVLGETPADDILGGATASPPTVLTATEVIAA